MKGLVVTLTAGVLAVAGCAGVRIEPSDPVQSYMQASWDAETEADHEESCDAFSLYGDDFWAELMDDLFEREPDPNAPSGLNGQRVVEFMHEKCG